MEAGKVWELFKETGNIGVYMLYKQLSNEENNKLREEQNTNADSYRGNCDKGNQCF